MTEPPVRITVTGILVRHRQRRSSANWMADWANQILEERGLRKGRYYAEECYLRDTDFEMPTGRMACFTFRRVPKALAEVPHGTRIQISASYEKYTHNNIGGYLSRPRLLKVVQEAPPPPPPGPSAAEVLQTALTQAAEILK